MEAEDQPHPVKDLQEVLVRLNQFNAVVGVVGQVKRDLLVELLELLVMEGRVFHPQLQGHLFLGQVVEAAATT